MKAVRNLWWLAASVLAGCSGGDDLGGSVGPCIHGYREPVLTITAATGAPSGTAIAQLALSGFSVNGQPRNVEEWGGPASTGSSPSFNVTVSNGMLYCNLPCGFGAEAGRYVFSAAADGHQTKQVTVDAAYATFEGGCPSFNDDGTDVQVELAQN